MSILHTAPDLTGGQPPPAAPQRRLLDSQHVAFLA
jgi:hypothetical protein